MPTQYELRQGRKRLEEARAKLYQAQFSLRYALNDREKADLDTAIRHITYMLTPSLVRDNRDND